VSAPKGQDALLRLQAENAGLLKKLIEAERKIVKLERELSEVKQQHVLMFGA
jgi:predicted RNase H-like nuclease (RuvC/YqgF family)